MKLTDTFLRGLKAPDKAEKHTDGGGLYLFASPTGGKLWRLDYRFQGQRKTLALGAYPAVSLKDARKRRDEAKEHLAAITDPKEIGLLLQAIDQYQGDISVLYALKMLPYVFTRSNELLGARWAEFDLKAAEWTIPGGRMKMKTPHSGHGEFLFPSPQSASKPMSDMGLLNALRRMGYQRGEMTIHGFRGTASTLLNEQGFRADVIEAQLAHAERNAVRKAYNHAQYMPERHRLMQAYVDYLDGLRAKAKLPD